jgi:hypothetical protein
MSKQPKKNIISTYLTNKPNKKKPIPQAVREQVWITKMGKVFEGKCKVPWCNETITVYNFQAGHNIPESKGGKTTIDNLIPICSRCNLSMNDNYTIDEWSKMYSSESVNKSDLHKPSKPSATQNNQITMTITGDKTEKLITTPQKPTTNEVDSSCCCCIPKINPFSKLKKKLTKIFK